MIVIVPSRGRPERAVVMVESVRQTASRPVSVAVVVDPDDEKLDAYRASIEPLADLVVLPKRLGYTGSLNAVAMQMWDEHSILGAFGDDVIFRTPGWDTQVEVALQTPGIAYGNDLVHAAGHPTAIFMSSIIAKALGYLAIPQSRHLWVDDAWKEMGTKAGVLRYLPDLIFEHMHPAVGKAEMDRTYDEVYDSVLGHQDHLGFLEWQANQSDADAAKIRAVLSA